MSSYTDFVKKGFGPVDGDRGKLAIAACLLAQQVDEIDLALQGVFDYDILEDAGDAMFAVAYIASIEDLDLEEMISGAGQKHYQADIAQLKATAIGVVSSVAQFANHTMWKQLPAERLLRRHQHALQAFLVQLAAVLRGEGATLWWSQRRLVQ